MQEETTWKIKERDEIMKENSPKLETCLKIESVSATIIFIRYKNHHCEVRTQIKQKSISKHISHSISTAMREKKCRMPTKHARLMPDFSASDLLARGSRNNAFKVVKFYFQPSILYPVKLSLKNEDSIGTY